MDSSGLFLGVLPLLIFVIADLFAGLKTALILTVIIAVAEAIASLVIFKELDAVSIASLVTVIALAAVSYYKKNPLFIKIQPALISLLIGLILLVSYVLGQPLLVSMAQKYKDFYPQHLQDTLTSPLLMHKLEMGTMTLSVAMLMHGFLTLWAAYKLNNWWWLAARGVGFYLFGFAAMILANYL